MTPREVEKNPGTCSVSTGSRDGVNEYSSRCRMSVRLRVPVITACESVSTQATPDVSSCSTVIILRASCSRSIFISHAGATKNTAEDINATADSIIFFLIASIFSGSLIIFPMQIYSLAAVGKHAFYLYCNQFYCIFAV